MLKNILSAIYFLLFIAFISNFVFCEHLGLNNTSIFASSQNESDAIQIFEKLTRNIIADDLTTSISRGWWTLSKKLIIKTHEQGIDLSPVVRSAELSIRRELNELTRLLNKKHSEVATLSPAFQWAQSSDLVYLNIKFTYRWNAPGALKIDNEIVSIHDNVFFFSAMGSHSHEKKKYVLNLELFDEVDSDLSECSFGSVGKLSCTLFKKKSNAIWPRLLKDQKLKIPNMHIWWEMREKHENLKANSSIPDGNPPSSVSNETKGLKYNSNSTINEEL
ncbi:uncharacterized protein cubi_01820 [Cryptosporidium ubiquitum]|uniref:CS domain-containing protein n=1 Tax=Cryptosporidium ubiquitum TaxID=857276 RepID=A0A1J4MPC3_9CRYT|nr:uncharacterized protein cubi_01820 [Cryptosporidium ubiquitum]OII75299.1 hypothetical protein cubi_01820 [Cryptosporidium ubiquitum]